MIRKIHRARYVLAEADLLLRDAAVHVSAPGRISRVEPWHGNRAAGDGEVIDWGSAILMPGLVNAHTHLELTARGADVPPPASFTEWLASIVDYRRGLPAEEFRRAAARGAQMSLESGTTMVADVSCSGASSEALRGFALRKTVFEEIAGFPPARAEEATAELRRRLTQVGDDPLLTVGVSPHAPYSVSPQLYRSVAAIARQNSLPLATHVAETKAEREFLAEGTGEFAAFLAGRKLLPEDWSPPRTSPISYLDSLGVLEGSALLIHCNYLDPASIAAILASRSSVVYCPRSHAFFGHDRHPVRQMLDAGVNVALGTDSLASNQSLSVLDEMRHLFGRRKDLRCEEILRMATLNGAAALNLGRVLGRLRRGYWADMTVLRLPEELGDRNLICQLLEGAGECLATIVAGDVIWRRGVLQ